MSKQTLVSGFGAFGAVGCNPTDRLVHWLAGEAQTGTIVGQEVTCLLLPVSYARAPKILLDAIQQGGRNGTLFDNVLMLGVAAGSTSWRVERWSHNFDGPFADVDGEKPGMLGRAILAEGPDKLGATLSLESLAAAINEAGLPVYLSDTAGGYLCNHVLYRALHHARITGHTARVGFLHVPADEQTFAPDTQPQPPCFPFEAHCRALRAALDALV